MQHATLVDEWLEEAVQKAVKETEIKAAQSKFAGIKEYAISSIVRILTTRFAISAIQTETVKQKLNQITNLNLFGTVEEQALSSFNFTEFTLTLDELLQTQSNTGSGQ